MRITSVWLWVLALVVIIAQAVQCEVAIADVSVKVVAKDGTTKKSESPSYPAPISAPLTLDEKDTLKVSFKAMEGEKPVTLHHAFLILTRKAKSEAPQKFAVTLLAEEKERGRYMVELDLSSSSNRDLFKGVPGSYVLAITTVPTLLGKSYALGEAEVNIPADPLWGLTSKVSGVEEVFAPRHEIEHIFGPPPRIAPRFVSDFFTLVVLAPWVGLLGVWVSLGANIVDIVRTPSSLLYGSSFLVLLSGWVVVMYLYWTVWNVFQLLFYGGLYALATAIVGRQALVVRAQLREKGSN